MNVGTPEVACVVAIAERLRPRPGWTEYTLQNALAERLGLAGISFERECDLGGGRRIDFLCEGGVGVECKHGKPSGGALRRQLARYASSDRVSALVLVSGRGLGDVPEALGDTPFVYVALSKLYGLAT